MQGKTLVVFESPEAFLDRAAKRGNPVPDNYIVVDGREPRPEPLDPRPWWDRGPIGLPRAKPAARKAVRKARKVEKAPGSGLWTESEVQDRLRRSEEYAKEWRSVSKHPESMSDARRYRCQQVAEKLSELGGPYFPVTVGVKGSDDTVDGWTKGDGFWSLFELSGSRKVPTPPDVTILLREREKHSIGPVRSNYRATRETSPKAVGEVPNTRHGDGKRRNGKDERSGEQLTAPIESLDELTSYDRAEIHRRLHGSRLELWQRVYVQALLMGDDDVCRLATMVLQNGTCEVLRDVFKNPPKFDYPWSIEGRVAEYLFD